MTDFESALPRWRETYHCRTAAPLGPPRVVAVLSELRALDTDLLPLYRACNGIRAEWFEVLPIEDPTNLKQTWDGLLRANDISKTRFLSRDPHLLSKFVVFASHDAGQCSVIDRSDNSVWFEENGELHLLSVGLLPFIETCLREVVEL
jgi:hypothetical protein